MVVGGIILACAVVHSDTLSPISPRNTLITFQGSLLDSEGLSCTGQVTAEVGYYDSTDAKTRKLLYSESFSAIPVQRGAFRLNLMAGDKLSGSLSAVTSAAAVFADVKINGNSYLTDWPLGQNLAAVRAEHAAIAEGLRIPFKITSNDVPYHDATLITTGQVKDDRIQANSVKLAAGGVFSKSQIPPFSAGYVTGFFPNTISVNGQISAAQFTQGIIPDALVPNDIMRKTVSDGGGSPFGVMSGTVHSGQAVQVPAGFSREECQWMVSATALVSPGDGTGIDFITAVTDQNGVVNCVWDDVTRGDGTKIRVCDANYLTICRR